MTTNQSSNLRPCPFCGGQALTKTFFDCDDLEYMPLDIIEPEVTCENERCINGWWLSPNDWNTRPIEDELRARIAELERDFDMLFRAVIAASKQSRKNTQTFVYGKESDDDPS